MKFVIKMIVFVLIAWPPVSGFAATGMPCHERSSQIMAMVNGMQTVPYEQAVDHSEHNSQTAPLPLACHGGACSFSCTGAAIPAVFLPITLKFSTAYQSLVDHRFSLFIPEQFQRPPLVA